MTPREQLLARIEAEIAEQRAKNGWTGYPVKPVRQPPTEPRSHTRPVKPSTVNWDALSPWGYRALGLAWIVGGAFLAWIIGSLCIGAWREAAKPGSSWGLYFLAVSVTIGGPLMLIRAVFFLWGGASMLISGKEPLS